MGKHSRLSQIRENRESFPPRMFYRIRYEWLCEHKMGDIHKCEAVQVFVLSTDHVRNLGAHAYRKFNAANILVV